jgi:hypothetical protein
MRELPFIVGVLRRILTMLGHTRRLVCIPIWKRYLFLFPFLLLERYPFT